METYYVFIAKASGCLSVFYLIGLLLFRNDNFFKLQRFYLWATVVLSLMLPFNPVSINFSNGIEPIESWRQKPEIRFDSQVISEAGVEKEPSQAQPFHQERKRYSLLTIFASIYWIIVAGILLRIIYNLIYIVVYFNRSKRKKEGKYTILVHPHIRSSFSFLRWIYIHGEIEHTTEGQNIIKHEIVHAEQYHSLDIIAIELLSAVMWFNPLIWLMRRGVQQLHEYLADEGVLNSGINVVEYQALLVNQVAGDRLICLPSGFKQSLIKKRLAMMTRTRINRKTGYRLLALLPLAGCMFMILSFTNKKEALSEKKVKSASLTIYNFSKPEPKISSQVAKKQEPKPELKRDTVKVSSKESVLQPPPPPSPPSEVAVVAAVSPTRMNVFYLGIDNPVDIAVAGLSADKVFPTIDNGSITRIGNGYVVRPRIPGRTAIHVIVKIDGQRKEVKTVEFRVKRIPDPVPRVAGKKGGSITLAKLLEADEVIADLENFDFDAAFVITEFTVAVSVSGFVKDIHTKTNKITDEQKELIRHITPGDKVYFNDIKGMGPDGSIRDFASVVFKIEE